MRISSTWRSAERAEPGSIEYSRRSKAVGEEERRQAARWLIGSDPKAFAPYDPARGGDVITDRRVVTDVVAEANLGDLVANHGPLAADQQVAPAARLAEAPAAPRVVGVIGRDSKAANVLRSSMGSRLADFGIAAGRMQTRSRPDEFLGYQSDALFEKINECARTRAADH